MSAENAQCFLTIRSFQYPVSEVARIAIAISRTAGSSSTTSTVPEPRGSCTGVP